MHEAAWLCQHCTYRNDRPGRVCQICSKSQHPPGPIVLDEEFYECSDSPVVEVCQLQVLLSAVLVHAHKKRMHACMQAGQEHAAKCLQGCLACLPAWRSTAEA